MRYIIGIDLGTTNSCVAYIDTQDPKLGLKSFKIPQFVAPGTVEALTTLPSFCYLPSLNEFPAVSFSLFGGNESQTQFFVGILAKSLGAKVPTRLVQSAKSWLCHTAINRRDKILPLEAADETFRISPVEATRRYLSHIRAVWNQEMAKGDQSAEFDEQEIILTVPASFDEVARGLTVEAAKKAGFVHLTLLEEPQAAFYSWIAQHESVWESQLKVGSKIIVCDVGGGTTDFSMIEVIEVGAKLAFQRMAVGEHLLLGGDNMDAAVAYFIESKITEKGHELTTKQRQQLFHQARAAKEKLLSKENNQTYRFLLTGEGSHVVKGTISVEINKEEIENLLLKGFFDHYSWDEALKLKKTAGFRSMGLPYEYEPSIIKHLARFIYQNGGDYSRLIKPDYILFNGGAMTPKLFQKSVISNLTSWFPENHLQVLSSFHLDLAVARGASYFGKARRGLGVKIGGGLARTYYLILDAKDSTGKIEKKALTLISRGSEEGVFEPSTTFMLAPNVPVSFQLATSNIRLNDTMGDLVHLNPEEIHNLLPIHTVLRFGKMQGIEKNPERIPVHLKITLTPIGTLEVALKSLKTSHEWALEFQLKSAFGQDCSMQSLNSVQTDQTFDSSFLKDAEKLIHEVFGEERGKIRPVQLTEKLEGVIGISRKEWSPSLMRGLCDILLKSSSFRKISPEHLGRWWNLVGFLLRPGFGHVLDDFRIKEFWKVILTDFKLQLSAEIQIQMWICYRRISGGLSKGQQMQLGNDLMASLFSKRSGKIETGAKAEFYAYSEKIRALCSMELLEISLKVRIGNGLVLRIQSGEASSVDYWALGRIGARHLVYGSLVNVIPKEICENWITKVLDVSNKEEASLLFLMEQLARKTEHPELNLASTITQRIIKKFEGISDIERLHELLLKENRLTQREQDLIFGDSLPPGLLLEPF